MKSTGNPWQLLNRLRSPFRIEVDGLDQLPVGGLILAVNRVGPHDHLYVAASLGRPATVVIPATSGQRALVGLRRTSWVTDPDSDTHPAASVGRGEILVVFPEVVAGIDGAVHRGHAEFAALALSSRCPIVPAGLIPLASRAESSRSWQGRVEGWLPEQRYCLRVGEPIPVTRYGDLGQPSDTVDGLILRGLTDLVMARISQLAGRRYVDSYTVRTAHEPQSTSALPRTEQARVSKAQRRAADQQRRAAEAELAQFLDEQEASRLEAAAEAARQHAQLAAEADERARQRRRRPTTP